MRLNGVLEALVMTNSDVREIFGDVMRRAQFGENCEPWIDGPPPMQVQWRNYADRIMRSLAAAGIELITRDPAEQKSAEVDGDHA